ncbi:methyl-accepting chemotaxis protein [Pseudomonas sp. REP124]|nr:methyl-accepting chemotaxis protein [Pseudomonas sp. REP124]MBZ9785591.1 methyl-accepting chemotaxis protein [Pseudomonas sp. REP124]
MFSAIRLRTKLLLLALVPIFLLSILFSAVSMVLLERLAVQQEELTRERLVGDHRNDIQQLVAMARKAIEPLYDQSANGDVAARAKAIEVLKRLSYGADGYFWGYDESGVRLLQGATEDKIGQSFSDYRDPNGLYAIRELVAAGKSNSHYVGYSFVLGSSNRIVPKIGYAEYLPKWGMVFGTSINLDDVDVSVEKERKQFRESINHSLLVMLGSTIALLIVVGILAKGMSGSILRPLLQIKASLDDMASGDGNLTHRLPVASGDELGELASSFNLFVDKIHVLVQQVAGTTTELSGLVSAVSSQAQRSEKAMIGQRHETEQVATAINEMSAAAHEVSASAQRAADAARETDEEGASAKCVVEGSVESIHQLVGEVRSSSDSLNNLRQDVQSIVGVLEVIRSIADQTNLLALNAAIEAARAGDAGRGFAVVADEVRALASRTQQSTGEIQRMIDSLHGTTRNAVEAMKRASAMGESTTEQAIRAGQSLDTIAELIGTINLMSAQIASAAEEQTAVAEEINRSVHEISVAVEGVADDAVQGASTARELNSLGGRLQVLVGQFKI